MNRRLRLLQLAPKLVTCWLLAIWFLLYGPPFFRGMCAGFLSGYAAGLFLRALRDE